MQKRRNIELWATCTKCTDQFSLSLWIRPGKEPDTYHGIVENSRDVRIEEGKPLHRCGGTLRVYGSVGRIILEE